MIRSLQRRFVITAMIAITVLLLFLLGGINAANIVITGNEIDRTLHVISRSGGNAENLVPDSPPPR